MTTAASLPESTLVRHVLAEARRPLPAATRTRLVQALLDWFTAGWSAIDHPGAAPFRSLMRATLPDGGGSSAVFGGGTASAPAAAFANAGIAHLREIDDAHRTAMLHPGVVTITPGVALAPDLRLTRIQVARAIVAGYEVAVRLGETLGPRHAALFHATATAGSVGAAAAAGVAMGFDAEHLHHALGIAATQAAGLWQLVDDDAHAAKSLHPAFAVRNGLAAAYAAAAGFPGAHAFVTGPRGLYRALSGDGPLAALDGGLDAPERLHTATIKAWPACAMLFTPLDATLSLIEAHAVRADQVAAIEIEIFPHALKIAGVEWPAQPAEAAFCLRYLVAVLLEKGAIGIGDTEAPDVGSPALRALAARTTVRANEPFQHAFPARRPSRVEIVLTDGRRFSAYRDLRRGDPEEPFTWAELQTRLRRFAPRLDGDTAARIVAWCEAFEDPTRDGEAAAPPADLFG